MAHLSTDLIELYKTYFQQPYCVSIDRVEPVVKTTDFSQPLSEKYRGVEVFLPVCLRAGEYEIAIPCATIRATSKKTIVRTVMSERQGTVKELFQAGDWEFTVKGVLIAENGAFPDQEILTLRHIYESTRQTELKNALSDLFLDNSRNVCISSLEFPEVEGKNIRHRPFVMVCESDFVTTLRL